MSLARCPCCGFGAASTEEARCEVCGHRWRQAPGAAHYTVLQNRNHLPAAVGERKFEDRLASIRPLLKDGMRILEIGCAEGVLGAKLKALAPVEYWGLEISADADRAAKLLDNVLRIPAAECDEGPFDLILSFHVLEHIEQIGEELQHWKRLLKPEGRLLVEVPNGAGHPLLARDANQEHAHQFSPASLTLAVQRAGFQVLSLGHGHFESPTYPDSLRLLAAPRLDDEQREARLLQRFRSRLGDRFVVYGLGGDFRNYVMPLLDRLPVVALCDGNPENRGEAIGRHTVAAFDANRFSGLPVLIASQRHEEEIRFALAAQGVTLDKLVGLGDIYDQQ